MVDKGPFCGTNRPADPSNMTEAEKKHTPVIECPDTVKAGEPFQVKIKVGEIPHVMEEGHHIQWICIHSGENFNACLNLTPAFTVAETTVTLVKGGAHKSSTISVMERCNLHGQWEATKEITITD
ncbi:MAG: superoxide reductase [Planctomycetes bacterium]|nr:superoxide reductase [Planctomycetota bacterium]